MWFLSLHWTQNNKELVPGMVPGSRPIWVAFGHWFVTPGLEHRGDLFVDEKWAASNP